MTFKEAAPMAGVALSTFYAGAHAGDVPVIRVGRRMLVPTAAFRRWLGLDVGQGDQAAPG